MKITYVNDNNKIVAVHEAIEMYEWTMDYISLTMYQKQLGI